MEKEEVSEIEIPLVFIVDDISTEEYRDPKIGIKNTIRIGMSDASKKQKSDKDWTPISRFCITLVDSTSTPNIKFGKKYRVSLEEIK